MFLCENCSLCDLHCECIDGEESIIEVEDDVDCPICVEELSEYLDDEGEEDWEEEMDEEDQLLGG